MSAQHLTALWAADLGGRAARKLVAARLADRANKDTGGDIYLSKASIARDTGLSPRQVQRQIQDLLDLGVLAVTRPATQHRPTQYRMPIDRLRLLARGDISDSPVDAGLQRAELPGETSATPLNAPGETSTASRGDTGDSLDVPRRSLGEVAAPARPPSAGAPGRALAPPREEVAGEWAALASERPELDLDHVREQALVLYADATVAELKNAMEKLRLVRHYRELDPLPRKSNSRSRSGPGGGRRRPININSFTKADYEESIQ